MAEWAEVTFVFPFQASSNHVPAEVQRSPICFIYGFAPGVMHSRGCWDFGREANTNEQRVFMHVCFLLRRPVTATIINHIFKACSPLTISRRCVTCCRYLRFTLPFALCCRQRSIILPRPVAPTKETSQARSRGETGKKTAATRIGCRQCHLWINSVSVWLSFFLCWLQTGLSAAGGSWQLVLQR